ncbi:MAG: type II toxin-antitoxin system VapC family toxin [Thermoanaerobaculia bacterium]
MKYWDTSAILPLLLDEARTPGVQALYEEDSDLAVWCLTLVEAASALARRSRKRFEADALEIARVELERLAESWTEVGSVGSVRSRALRLLNTHPLGAADALQLGAALVASEERPESLPFVCLDDRLRDAARNEGFKILPP